MKPGNLGAMARSAEAAGASGVLAADGVVDPFNPNCMEASTAAVTHMPVVVGASQDIVAFLRQRHVQVITTMPRAHISYTQVDMTLPTALVIGAEDHGLPVTWMQTGGTMSQTVSIPILGRVVDSLNASVAAAIVLFEAVRQRGP